MEREGGAIRIPLSPAERRKLVETPFTITTFGSAKGHYQGSSKAHDEHEGSDR